MAAGLIVEPISTDFDIQVLITSSTSISKANHSNIKDKIVVRKAEIQAQVKQLVEVENLSIDQVSTTLCVSQSTVRRICRTLKIGQYLSNSGTGLKTRSSQVPFGWNSIRGILEKNPKEWRSVILMHQLRIQGNSLHKIAAELTLLSVPTKNGGKWFAKTVSQILKLNEKFLTNQQTDRRIK